MAFYCETDTKQQNLVKLRRPYLKEMHLKIFLQILSLV